MALPNDEVVAILQRLLEICRDGNQGYKDAGDDVKEQKMRELLYEYSEQRMNYSLELKDLIDKHGGDINISGSILGSIHRRWMDIRFSVTGPGTESILTECLRGEKAAMKKYEEALKQDLPANAKEIIERQYNGILRAVDNLNKLIETYRMSAAAE